MLKSAWKLTLFRSNQPTNQLTILCFSADYLDSILMSMQNDTECPCSHHYCESQPNRGANKGYIVAVALVRKLKREPEK